MMHTPFRIKMDSTPFHFFDVQHASLKSLIVLDVLLAPNTPFGTSKTDEKTFGGMCNASARSKEQGKHAIKKQLRD